MTEQTTRVEEYVYIGKRQFGDGMKQAWYRVEGEEIEATPVSFKTRFKSVYPGQVYRFTVTGDRYYTSGPDAPRFDRHWADAGLVAEWKLVERLEVAAERQRKERAQIGRLHEFDGMTLADFRERYQDATRARRATLLALLIEYLSY